MDHSDKLRNSTHKVKSKKLKIANGKLGEGSHNKDLKKKILLMPPLSSSHKSNNEKIIQYKSTKSYATVFARPGSLKSVPKIFFKNSKSNSFLKKVKNNSFVLNLLTTRSLNSSLNDRFSYIPPFTEKVEKLELEKLDKKTPYSELPCASLRESSDSPKTLNVAKQDIKKSKKNRLIPFSECENVNENQSETINVNSYADFYEVINKNAQILHLHHPCKFSFHGELKMTLLAGEIEILGCVINKSSQLKTISAFSPESCTPLLAQTKDVDEEISNEEIRGKLITFLHRDNISQLLDNYKPNDCLLHVEQISSSFGFLIEKYTSLKLFPKNLEDVSSTSEALKKLQCTFKFDPIGRKQTFRKNEIWDTIPLHHCTVLCGGKGVGKSTLLRYYINKSISSGEKLLVLDFDPGQPEFSPPGFVSAVVVDKPLLGPNFTHVTDGAQMIYFGDVNTAQSPKKYLDCVDYLIQWCRSNGELSKMKWIVNTMGFCKGLGVELMISIIKLINPSTVIQIKSCKDANNYPFYLTSESVNRRKGFGDLRYLKSVIYEFWTINSTAEVNNQRKSDLTSVELRNLLLLSYFSRLMIPPYYSLNATQPFIVPFKKLYLAIDNFIHPKDILRAFNGNLVSLGRLEVTTEIVLSVPSDSDYFKIIMKPTVTPCFGLGFVRGIDCEGKKMYVITHLDIDTLQNVNCLTLGRINLPPFIFLNQETVVGSIAYTSVSTSQAVQRVKREFRKAF